VTGRRTPEPADPFEEDGLPALDEQGLAAKQITGDVQEGMAAPADHPTYVDAYGVTAAEQAHGASLDERVRAEEPDVLAQADQSADESADAADPYPEDRDERAGRLVEPDEGARADTEADLVAADAGTDEGGFSAEERAIHIEPEA
jgi:hypothetical protein